MNAEGVVSGGVSQHQANGPPDCAQSVPNNLYVDMS